MCVPIGIFVRCVVDRGPVGNASPGAFGWCMIIKVRLAPKTSSLVQSSVK